MTKVHVLMPAYNAAPFIEKSIASLQAQDYDNFHVLVLNDGSTDETAATSAALIQGDNRFTLIDCQDNQGISPRRAELVARSRELDPSACILWLDSDDCYTDPAFLRLFAEKMGSTQADVCLFNFSVIFETDDPALQANATGLMKDRAGLADTFDGIARQGIASIDTMPAIATFTSLGCVKGYGPSVSFPVPAPGAFEDFVYMAVLYRARRVVAFPSSYQPLEILRRSTSTTGRRTDETARQVISQLRIFQENIAGLGGERERLGALFVEKKLAQYGALFERLATDPAFPDITPGTVARFQSDAKALLKVPAA